MKMINVEDVSMRFVMANDKVSSIKEFVTAFLSRKLKFKDFWALTNINFEVNKGEVVGIIGRNGAGKSTLLKIISGILRPTTGKVVLNGNIVPMLELGSGFDPDLTGAENIFLNGAILGYSKEFLQSKYDEIVRFSELGDFIRMPIRNYSSGMLMRLAFSIATVVQPEILIVDEILAVGDENFQKKSKQRMMELMGGGTTVLFVSHDMQSIREMCSRVVWLEGGTVKMFGDTETVCDAYDISAPDPRKDPKDFTVDPRAYVAPKVMQFDHFHRYETARKIVEWSKQYIQEDRRYKILEVGTLEPRILKKMFLTDQVDGKDIFQLEDIKDRQYDFTVALDVLNGIKKEKRAEFIDQLLRITKQTVILGFPFETEKNRVMEQELSEYYAGIFGVKYIWFEEHQRKGLPSAEMVKEHLEKRNYYFTEFQHADVQLLSELLKAQFHSEYYRAALQPYMDDISLYYETEIYPHDVGRDNYRSFFCISADKALVDHVTDKIKKEFVRIESV